jgi:phage tail tape-measure protein
MIKHAALLLGIVLLSSTAGYGQRTPTKDEIDRAQLVLSRALNSDSAAEHHILFLQSYVERSPWQFRTLVNISQKLLAVGESLADIQRSISACGDAAVATSVNDDDATYERIVFALFSVKRGRDSLEGLAELESEGVPAYVLLGEATGYSASKIRGLAEAGRIKSRGAFDLLLDAFERKYSGLAIKRAEQLNRRAG